MKKLETKGRSRKQRHHLFHKEMKQMKRLLSVCLCTSMISTSIGSTTALAATAPLLEKNEAEEENQNFVLDQEELSEVLLKAVKGKPVKEDALTFEGEESEAYETLFQEDGSLFELHPDVKAPDGKVNLKVYARLDEKEDLDHYTITGEEEILFLLLNRSSEKEYGQIEVDGKRSGKVSILSSKELKKQIQDEEMEASEETGVSISNGAEEKSNKTAGESEKKENVKETDSQEPEKENPVETPEKVDKLENPASEPEKGSEAENPANKAENGAEAENPANEPEKSQEAGSGAGDAGKTGTPEEKDSQPDADSGSENEKNDSAGSEAGDVAQVSRSDHFKMFLTAAPATASEIQTEDETSEKETNTADQPDAETEVEIEDGAERLEGETYESVLLKNTAATAFVTTAAELGLSGSVDDAVYTVNTDSAVLTLTVPAGAFEEKVKLKAYKVNYTVENTRVGNMTDYDKLTLEVWTDSTISARDAVSLGAKILSDHLSLFTNLSETVASKPTMAEKAETHRDKVLEMTIEELDLSVRSFNCLKRANINTVEDLISKTEDEMMKVRNLGRKSLEEVINKLAMMGLHLADEENN